MIAALPFPENVRVDGEVGVPVKQLVELEGL